MEEGIGATVRSLRLRRGLSLEVLAGLVGRDKSWLSRVERGLRPLERRKDIAALADALQVSVVDLTGQPYVVPGKPEDDATTAIPALRRALQDLPNPAARAEIDQLDAQASVARQMHDVLDHCGLGRVLPGLLVGLQSTIPAVANAEERRRLQRLLFWAAFDTHSLCRNLGYLDLSWIAAERAYGTAADLGDPAWLAAVEYIRAHALVPSGASTAALGYASAGADAASTLDGLDARGVHGSLLLVGAYSAALTGAFDEAEERLRAAEEVAVTEVGRTFADRFFLRPVNVELHRMAVAVEAGQPDQVIATAQRVIPDSLATRADRHAMYWVDLGRAHAQLRHDDQAIAALRNAEAASPLRTRLHPLVRETVTGMLGRAQRAAVGRDLRGLAYRMGVPH